MKIKQTIISAVFIPVIVILALLPIISAQQQYNCPMGGFGGMMGGGGTSLDPLVNADNPQQPLAYKLLSVPELRAKYLEIVRDIAEKWLDWERLGPIAKRYHDLIAGDVRADSRKLYSTDAFDSGLKTIESFAKARRTYLLAKTAPKTEVKAEVKTEAKLK